MATTLIIRGAQVELAEEESFNKVKGRIKAAKSALRDYELGITKSMPEGSTTELSFYTEPDDDGETGRIYVDIADVFGCMSDKRKD